VMSMQSRSKQRRAGAGKHKNAVAATAANDNGTTASTTPGAAALPAPQAGTGANKGGGAAATPEQAEAEVRELLVHILGPDWDSAAEDTTPVSELGLPLDSLAAIKAGLAATNCNGAAPAATAGVVPTSGATMALTGSKSESKRSGRKKKTQVAAAAAANATAPTPAPAVAAAAAAVAAPLSIAAGTAPASVQHRLIEPPQLLSEALSRQCGEGDEDEVDAVVRDEEEPAPLGGFSLTLARRLGGHTAPSSAGPTLDADEARGSSASNASEPSDVPRWGSYFPGQHLLQSRMPWTFHESMEHIAIERRRAYDSPGGVGSGHWAPSTSSSVRASGSRARSFNEALRSDLPSPIPTPAGTFIRTPTWTSADSGEFGGTAHRDLRDDPVYVQPCEPAPRWVGESPYEEGIPDRIGPCGDLRAFELARPCLMAVQPRR